MDHVLAKVRHSKRLLLPSQQSALEIYFYHAKEFLTYYYAFHAGKYSNSVELSQHIRKFMVVAKGDGMRSFQNGGLFSKTAVEMGKNIDTMHF